jgi:hypothetical protein
MNRKGKAISKCGIHIKEKRKLCTEATRVDKE